MGFRGGQGDRQWGVEGTGRQTVGCRGGQGDRQWGVEGDRGTDSGV